MRLLFALFLIAGVATADAAEKPKAPAGFKWKAFKEAYCEIQIPDGWFIAKRTQGLTQVVLASPEPIADGQGIDTGFTINTVKCKSQEEWQEAMELAGILGAIWWAWHLPTFFIQALSQSQLSIPLFLLNTVALSVLMTGLYLRTRGENSAADLASDLLGQTPQTAFFLLHF